MLSLALEILESVDTSQEPDKALSEPQGHDVFHI